jgi:hypothetical protein|tara:strand:- start:2196 stop:2399 length:204 start_codon:yes stop_codon:yes gene_type:complete
MKEINLPRVSMDEQALKKQMKISQTINKINTLMDVAEGMNSQQWDGVQKLNIIVQIENKLIKLIDEL